MKSDQSQPASSGPIAGLLCFAAGGLYGWSAMIPALQSRFSTDTEKAGLVFSIAIAAFSIAVLLAPRLPTPARGLRGAGICGLFGAACLGLAAGASGFPIFVAAYSVGFGMASGAIYILVLEVAGRSARPHRMTALMVASFGFGGVVFGPILRQMVAVGWGLNALWVLALILCLVSLVGLATRCLVPSDPESSEHQGGGEIPSGIVILLWVGFGFGSVAGLMILGLATAIIETRGGTVWLSTLVLFGIAVGNTMGRLSAGAMEGKLPIGWMVPVASVLSCTGLFVAVVFSSSSVTAIGLVIVASGYGLTASSFPILTRHIVGQVRFARVYSIVFTAWGVAGLLSPWLAGKAFDATGDFSLALVSALLASLGALSVSVILGKQLPSQQG